MKRKPKPPLEKHAKHRAEVRPGVGPHAGQLWCVKCNKHVSWLSKIQYEAALKS
jgi:hypothetical protein